MISLKEIILKAKERGYSNKEIKELLLKKGYADDEIKKEFTSLGFLKRIKNPEKLESVTFYKKIKMFFSEPKEFFCKVRDKTIVNSLVMYVLVSLVILLINFGLYFISTSFSGSFSFNYLFRNPFLGLYGFIIWPIVGIIITFIYSGVSHLVAKIMKGDGNYIDSYNIVTYSLIPAKMLSIIPIVGFFAYIYSIVLMTFGFSEYHKISKGKAVILALIPPLLLFGVIAVLYFGFLGYFF